MAPLPPSNAGADTAPGDLYADLATRTIWLGVDNAVDPAGVVLLSDYLGTAQELALRLTDASGSIANDGKYYGRRNKAWAEVAPLASPAFTGNPTAVTQAAGNNTTRLATTAFVKAAVDDAVADIPTAIVPRGSIMLWYGSITAIGTGNLAGWHLCDGTTLNYNDPVTGAPVTLVCPDLRDKFIVGAGNAHVPNANNGVALDADTDTEPDHAHTITGTVLTVANLPSHTHNSGTLAGTATGNTGADGSHYTAIHYGSLNAAAGSGDALMWKNIAPASIGVSTIFSDVTPNHTHTINATVDVNSGATAAAGSGTSHTHVCQGAGGHAHKVTKAEVKGAIQWYALAYIIKL